MHCPSCGQQQVSNETKFCSRCGLPLGLVGEVVAYGGYLPQLAELNTKKKSRLTRKNGLAFSLIWFLFFLFIMTPLWGILEVERLAAASAVIGIFGALIWLVSSFIFLEKSKFVRPLPANMYGHAPTSLPGQQVHGALPPQQQMPADFYAAPRTGSWRDTTDLPGSVTENTTQLLSKEDKN